LNLQWFVTCNVKCAVKVKPNIGREVFKCEQGVQVLYVQRKPQSHKMSVMHRDS